MYFHYIIEDDHIIDGVIIDSQQSWNEAVASLGDGQSLVYIGRLEDWQIVEYLDRLPDWDDPCVRWLMMEMCDRLKLYFEDYETYNDLFDEITKEMEAAT